MVRDSEERESERATRAQDFRDGGKVGDKFWGDFLLERITGGDLVELKLNRGLEDFLPLGFMNFIADGRVGGEDLGSFIPYKGDTAWNWELCFNLDGEKRNLLPLEFTSTVLEEFMLIERKGY